LWRGFVRLILEIGKFHGAAWLFLGFGKFWGTKIMTRTLLFLFVAVLLTTSAPAQAHSLLIHSGSFNNMQSTIERLHHNGHLTDEQYQAESEKLTALRAQAAAIKTPADRAAVFKSLANLRMEVAEAAHGHHGSIAQTDPHEGEAHTHDQHVHHPSGTNHTDPHTAPAI
jgi:hypothetical protein